MSVDEGQLLVTALLVFVLVVLALLLGKKSRKRNTELAPTTTQQYLEMKVFGNMDTNFASRPVVKRGVYQWRNELRFKVW